MAVLLAFSPLALWRAADSFPSTKCQPSSHFKHHGVASIRMSHPALKRLKSSPLHCPTFSIRFRTTVLRQRLWPR